MEDSGCGLRQGGNFFPEVPISHLFHKSFYTQNSKPESGLYHRSGCLRLLHQIPSECIQILCADFSIEPEKEPESSQTAVNGVF